MKLNYSLDDLRCFCAVAQYGSFKAAALALDIPLSTLSRRISKLEQDLSIRLLNRDAHKVTLTQTGQKYFARSHGLFESLVEVASDLHKDKHEARGRIRIAGPINVMSELLSDQISGFMQDYPDIQLEMKLSNYLIDIEAEGIDVAFRVGDVNEDNWIAKSLTDIQFIVCASPSLDTSKITKPAQLADYPIVLCYPMRQWELVCKKNHAHYNFAPGSNVRFETDDLRALFPVVQSGLGIGYIPDYSAKPMIKSGLLVQLLPNWGSQPRRLSMLYRDRKNMPLRVRLFINYMAAAFSESALG
ncbi:HTH-type transcriptional regulator DmlR [Marinomonas spartinae]|uniref:HTH-type transcriptional regulator DmlR n=1 Tax=Marinomonas spartinae TaxID=1792290 RepID=A0A1A8T1E2_9GAMM|nr:LysR family transcriptional regulator [Marinomonas spartinae]SBS25754.1 HTH-type transcriptional regulator DmlR [Marinomonas spartinae]